MILKEQLRQMKNATIARMPKSIIQVFEDSINTLKRDRLKEGMLQLGDQIPNLILQENNGTSRSIDELIQGEYLILNFYRGGWCPYCNMELREYEKLKEDFKKLHADIVGISAETPEKAIVTTQKNNLTIPTLTDKDAVLMKAIGIVFQLDEALKVEYKNFGIHLSEIHDNDNYELQVPAVLVINKKREIVFSHFEEDYMTRLEPTELLKFIQEKLTLKIN